MDEETVDETKVITGLPAPSFLPLAPYKLRQLTDLASLTIPLRGDYPEDSVIKGAYDISPAPGVILFGTLTEAIVGLGKYPTLSEAQRFTMVGVEVEGDNITVIGRVIEMVAE